MYSSVLLCLFNDESTKMIRLMEIGTKKTRRFYSLSYAFGSRVTHTMLGNPTKCQPNAEKDVLSIKIGPLEVWLVLDFSHFLWVFFTMISDNLKSTIMHQIKNHTKPTKSLWDSIMAAVQDLCIELSIIAATRGHCKVTFPLGYPLLLGGQRHLRRYCFF